MGRLTEEVIKLWREECNQRRHMRGMIFADEWTELCDLALKGLGARPEASLGKDAARLKWLEDNHTLHKSVEILYVVDGYQVTLLHEDGITELSPRYEGHDLASAIDTAMENEPSPQVQR